LNAQQTLYYHEYSKIKKKLFKVIRICSTDLETDARAFGYLNKVS